MDNDNYILGMEIALPLLRGLLCVSKWSNPEWAIQVQDTLQGQVDT